jgi:hypothetical protein
VGCKGKKKTPHNLSQQKLRGGALALFRATNDVLVLDKKNEIAFVRVPPNGR